VLWAVGCEHAVVPGQVHPGPGDRAASRAIKSNGWNTTRAVPSRYEVLSWAAIGGHGHLAEGAPGGAGAAGKMDPGVSPVMASWAGSMPVGSKYSCGLPKVIFQQPTYLLISSSVPRD